MGKPQFSVSLLDNFHNIQLFGKLNSKCFCIIAVIDVPEPIPLASTYIGVSVIQNWDTLRKYPTLSSLFANPVQCSMHSVFLICLLNVSLTPLLYMSLVATQDSLSSGLRSGQRLSICSRCMLLPYADISSLFLASDLVHHQAVVGHLPATTCQYPPAGGFDILFGIPGVANTQTLHNPKLNTLFEPQPNAL